KNRAHRDCSRDGAGQQKRAVFRLYVRENIRKCDRPRILPRVALLRKRPAARFHSCGPPKSARQIVRNPQAVDGTHVEIQAVPPHSASAPTALRPKGPVEIQARESAHSTPWFH